jgi:hypothetical protein
MSSIEFWRVSWGTGLGGASFIDLRTRKPPEAVFAWALLSLILIVYNIFELKNNNNSFFL